jgi:hypothetical protein
LGDNSAAAAVEFALVVPMLLALVFSTIEAGWTMVQSIMLDRALDVTIRELRLGKIVNPTHALVRAEVCAKALVLQDCDTALTLEFIPITPVTSVTSYPTDATRCLDHAASLAPVLRFNAGNRAELVFVRACFVVEPLTPGLGLGLALPKDSTGAYRIIAKSGFMNEPA